MTWWHNASKEQRLAQIDGGIELGLMAKQIALVSSASERQIAAYANSHGRYFGKAYKLTRYRRARAELTRFRRDYNSGAPVAGFTQ